MDFKGVSQAYAKDRLPAGYFQVCQNIDLDKRGIAGVSKRFADTGITDTTDVKLGTCFYRDKRGRKFFITVEGAGLAAELEQYTATNPNWTN